MFSRQTVWTNEQGQSLKFLQSERDFSKSVGQFWYDAFGDTNGRFFGFAAAPVSGVLQVSLAAGSLYQWGPIDPTTWSTLSSDSTNNMLQGVSFGATALTGFSSPVTSGFSINYLIESQIVVTDSAAVSTPFYNSSNPSSPIMTQKSPARVNQINFQVKAGTAAATGTQTSPAADSSWMPMYVVTVDYGETFLLSNDIALASGAQPFYGFVGINPNGNTPVFLSPASQQTGTINISGVAQVGTIQSNLGLLGGATTTANFKTSFLSGVAGDYFKLTSVGYFGSVQGTDSMSIAGSIGYTGTHAGTDGDPYPESQLNVHMLGGKVASDYALASGHYIVLYTGTPTPDATNINAAINGYFQINVATGTAPLVIASTTQVNNLNVQLLQGFQPGNASGNIPISNGTLCTNLNAQLLGGLASAAYQLAGNYATMNATNTGAFTATLALSTTGATGSTQTSLAYSSTNSFGLNAGGALSYIQALSAPLGLVGSSIRTSGPLYIGDGSPQSAYMQDLVPTGLLRAGICVYTVTYGGTGNSYPRPGVGTAFGYQSGMAGQVNVGADTVFNGISYIGFRCRVTLSGSLGVSFAALGLPNAIIYVDGSVVATLGGGPNNTGPVGYTFSSGTHTVDIIYKSYLMGNAYYLGGEGVADSSGGNLTVFGWLPFSGGQLSSAITALAPG